MVVKFTQIFWPLDSTLSSESISFPSKACQLNLSNANRHPLLSPGPVFLSLDHLCNADSHPHPLLRTAQARTQAWVLHQRLQICSVHVLADLKLSKIVYVLLGLSVSTSNTEI